jgi:predicted nucleic acid-binding protein
MITQRDLRNDSGAMLRDVQAGQTLIVTRNGVPVDVEAARTYGRVFAATKAAGRSSRTRFADLLIASTAAANGLPLYTRNAADFAGLE